MPWREPKNLRLTRIDVVAQVPSESGVYAILDGEACILVGEAWNLKARLLEMMNVLQDIGEFHLTYELCPEEDRVRRKEELGATLLKKSSPIDFRSTDLPGISFRSSI